MEMTIIGMVLGAFALCLMVLCFSKTDGLSGNMRVVAQGLQNEVRLTAELASNSVDKVSAQIETLSARLDQAQSEIAHHAEVTCLLEAALAAAADKAHVPKPPSADT